VLGQDYTPCVEGRSDRIARIHDLQVVLSPDVLLLSDDGRMTWATRQPASIAKAGSCYGNPPGGS
jgi:hypothetical protein